ncbi:MAG: hypothetical protein D6778_06675, partial [Nitrospirae bacterium]
MKAKALSTRKYDAIRRAMEDVQRLQKDYYLDIDTLTVIELPVEVLKQLETLLYEIDSDYEFGVVYDSSVRT